MNKNNKRFTCGVVARQVYVCAHAWFFLLVCPTRGCSRRVPRVKVAASCAVMMLEGDRCDLPEGSGDETFP